jgi:hypothetical protein
MSAFQWNGFQIDAFQVQDDVIFPDVAIEVELAGMFSGWTNIASARHPQPKPVRPRGADRNRDVRHE